MDRHSLIVLAAVLWAFVLVATVATGSKLPPRNFAGEPLSPPGSFLAVWTGALVFGLLAAVGLTAWLAS